MNIVYVRIYTNVLLLLDEAFILDVKMKYVERKYNIWTVCTENTRRVNFFFFHNFDIFAPKP